MRHVTQATYHRKIKISSANEQNNEVDKYTTNAHYCTVDVCWGFISCQIRVQNEFLLNKDGRTFVKILICTFWILI